VLTALILIRIVLLRKFGSNNPNGLSSANDKTLFRPFYTSKDLFGFFLYLGLLSFFVFFLPDSLSRPDNYVKANALVTPASIVPEFYLLFAYAILKSIPNKLGGILGLAASIVVLLVTPFTHTSKVRSNRFKPISRKLF
jgi:ubiquinol-cytochrome c reductase cytochrome b subunit